MDVAFIRKRLATLEIDGWLLYDFQGLNPLARSMAGLTDRMLTRRWFCLIPAEGSVEWLVSKVEETHFGDMPGKVRTYFSWNTLRSGLTSLLQGCRRVAMEYAPLGTIPYVSRVDGGTLELVRESGAEIVPSADLVQWCEARWSAHALATHLDASRHLTAAREKAFHAVAQAVRSERRITEYDVQQIILEYFDLHDLTTAMSPIAAVGKHTSDPHYQPLESSSAEIEEGDLLLVDLWAKSQEAGAVYADITWMAYVGDQVPDEYVRIFSVVTRARDVAVEFVRQSVARGETIRGFQVDDVARSVVVEAGYGDRFIHRTGHNIGIEDHGAGVNFDNLETHDERTVIPDIACSIEPGVYLDLFGMRSEVNIYVGERRADVTTTPVQRGIVPLLAER